MDNTLIDKLKAVQQLIIKQPNTSEYLYNDNTLGLKDCKICNGIGMILRKEDDTYIKCDEELEKLKQLAYEQQEEYSKIMFNLKNIGLLFIDDFFRRTPTEADKAKIFDIINFRYVNNKPCILSSEKMLFEILNIDEAIGSRIFEKAKNFNIEIEKEVSKNYRLKG